MADLRYKVVVDDAEAKRRLADLLKGTGVGGSGDGKAQVSSLDAVRAATVKLKEAQLANIEALRQSRLEAAKQKQEQAELNQAYLQGKITAQEYALAKRKQADADKEAARQARETKRALMANSEYSQLASALNTVRNQAKNTLAEMAKLERQGRKNSAAYQDLTQKSRLLVSQTQVLDNQIKRIDATVGQHQRKVGNYGDAISMVAPQLSMFAGRLGLVAAGVAAVNQSFTSNLRMEPINMALKVGSGNAEQFNKNLEFLRETTDRLGLEFISTSNAFKMWQGAAKFSNLTANETRGIFESVANAGAKMKLSNEQVEGTFLALSQMLSKGKVQAEELRGQLGERLPGAFALAAKAMGITEQELNKMLEKGEVIADEFLPRFAAQLDKSFGNDKSERIQGMQASVNRLKNEFDKLWQSERASGFFTVVTDGFARMFKDINLMVNSKSWAEFKAIAFGGQEEHAKWQQSQKSPIQNIMEDFQKQSKAEMESSIIAYKKTVDHFKKEGMSKDLKFNEAILYRMTDEYKKQYGVVKAINSSTTDEKAKRVASEQLRAMERQRALQLQIDQINQQSLRGQLSRDEQEVASIRDKYSKIREEVRKFYADPKNKGLRVDMSGISQAENFEISEATTRQETARLVERLNEQKSLYDEYNSYVEQSGVEAADRLFGKQAEIAKSYRAELDAEYISLLGKQKTASTGMGAGSKFTQAEEERLKQLQAMRDAESKNEDVRSRKQMDEALKLALSFNDKRLEIERKYQEARKALGENITPEHEQELKRKESKELSQLASEELSQSDAWQKLFSDLDALTISQIDRLVKEIEAKFEGLSGAFDPIDLAAIRKRLDEARNILIADNPFMQVGTAIRDIFNSSADDSKASAEDIKRNWTNLARATDSSFGFINDAVSSTELLKDALGDVGQLAISSLQSIGSAGIAVASAIKTAGETMTAVEKASVVLAAVQATLVVVQAITSFLDGAAKRRNEQLEREQEYYNTLSDTFDILINKQKQFFSERSGKTALDAYKEALDLVNSKQIANRKSLEAWFAQGASWKSHSNWYNYDRDLGNVLSRQKLLNMSGKEWENLLRNQPELWARLPEEVRAFGQSMMDARGQAEELRDAMQESLTGISLDDVKSEFDNLFSQADITFGDISDSFYKHMQKAVLRMVQDGKMTDSIKKWYDNVMDAMDDESLTKAESDALKAEYQAIVEAGQKRTKEIMDLIGYDPQKENETIQGRINKGLAETTGSEILGFERARYDMAKKSYDLMTVQVSNQQKYIMIANDKLVALNAIQINTANTVQRLDTAVVHLQQIVRNTGGTTGRTAEGMGL